MPRPSIPATLRNTVAEDARYRCGYCLTSQQITGMPMHLDHIIPLAAGGNSDEANLWLACPLCNGSKSTRTHFTDPTTGEHVALFNPRTQTWTDHFSWSEDGTQIIGRTPQGRATVEALKLNTTHLTAARRRWVVAGWHPPID